MNQMQHFGVYAVLLEGSRILTVKKAKGPYTGFLDLPGGTPLYGEAPLETLKREVKEETGVITMRAELWNHYTSLYQYQEDGIAGSLYHTGVIYYVKEYNTQDLILDMNLEDSLGAYWLDMDHSCQYQLTPFLKQALEHLSISKK